jgi:hypothetical protein
MSVPHNPETRLAALTEAANLVRPSAVTELSRMVLLRI